MVTMINAFFELVGNVSLGTFTGLNEYVDQWTNGRFAVLSMQSIMAVLFAPIAWIIGVSGQDILVFGSLLGEKIVINEFVAFHFLLEARDAGLFRDPRSVMMATFALCGFANFASIGIQIGGISVLAPAKRSVLCSLGVRALIAGTVATLMTATLAGILLTPQAPVADGNLVLQNPLIEQRATIYLPTMPARGNPLPF